MSHFRIMFVAWFAFAIASTIYSAETGRDETVWIVGAVVVAQINLAAHFLLTEIKLYISTHLLERTTNGSR